ncbi:Similar to Autophagy-related protein 2; acc. no. Q0CSI0 [Pyronema omphalodes CBS 100304]|uniref:Autophagy-related protein 2 n=1 Tax=Pyronema omphalodes (strain CBS 100304) TaxID=1076935 RepID=U4LYF8_PYROM|nr:Similar to Autophagy-related protein 2; acc. no. Q0CSI0 [Pyronema omphalodes CBS 100304]
MFSQFKNYELKKRLLRFILTSIDILDDGAVDDLTNLDTAFGFTSSNFTLKGNVGLKVKRLRSLLNLTSNIELHEAAVGSVSIAIPTIPTHGAVEIVLSDVRISAEIIPRDPDDSPTTPSPPRTPTQDAFGDEEFTVEALAKSYILSQPKSEQEELLEMAASLSEDDDGSDVGIGQGLYAPDILVNMFKGIADRMVVRVRGIFVSAGMQLPEEKGGEHVKVDLEIDDVDIEGVSRNTGSLSPMGVHTRPRKEGKRRITLENLRVFVSAPETIFGAELGGESAVFGTASEAPTEKYETTSPHVDSMGGSQGTIREPIPTLESHSPTPLDSPRQSQSLPPVAAPHSDHNRDSDSVEDIDTDSDSQSFHDLQDSDDDELAFAPSASRASTRRSFLRKSDYSHRGNPSASFRRADDSDDEADGGAMFNSAMPLREIASPASVPSNSSSVASLPAPTLPSPQVHTAEDGPAPVSNQPLSSSMSDNSSDSGDDMDQEASRMLSQSTIFSHKEADSLYMSAASGTFLSAQELQIHSGHNDEEEDNDIVDEDEIDKRLDWITDHASSSPMDSRSHSVVDFRSETPTPRSIRTIRKKCVNIENITIYFPSLADGTPTAPSTSDSESHNECDNDRKVPGAFSSYLPKNTPQSPPPQKGASFASSSNPKPKGVRIVEPSAPNVSDRVSGNSESEKVGDIEIISSQIRGTVDIYTEKMLAQMLEIVQDAFATDDDQKSTKQKSTKPSDAVQKTIQVIAEEIDIRMIKRLGGFYTDNGQEDVADETIQLQCLLNDVRLFQRGLPEEASTSKLSVKRFALKDEEEGIITFLRNAPPPNSSKMTPNDRKRAYPSTAGWGFFGDSSGDDHDIVVVFSQSAKKVRVNVTTHPIKITGNLKRLEETFSAFGGVGTVLASTTASTATLGKSGRPTPRSNTEPSTPPSNFKMNCRIEGLFVDVVGSNSKVCLETSPFKIMFATGQGITIAIPKTTVHGPIQNGDRDVRLKIENMELKFEDQPNDDDLSAMLAVVVPSNDSFHNDDVLSDLLVKQRKAGGILRINVQSIKGKLPDLNVMDTFKELGDEVIQLLAVTDFVAGDARPGLLINVSVTSVHASAFIDGGLGELAVDLDYVHLIHITAPALFATGIHDITVRRNNRELLGNGLPRDIFSSSDQNRPMIRMRMIGEEEEPVVKIKFWNVRVEYNVQTLMEIMEAPEGTTGEQLTASVVKSISQLPPREESPDKDSNGFGFDVTFNDSAIVLNPLGMKSRGVFILSNSRLNLQLAPGGNVLVGLKIDDSRFMAVDDFTLLCEPQPGKHRWGGDVFLPHVAGFVSSGYVPIIKMTSINVKSTILERESKTELLPGGLVVIESCPDSTKTVGELFGGLSPPSNKPEGKRYRTEANPVNLFDSIYEDAFVHPDRVKPTPLGEEDDDIAMIPKHSFREDWCDEHDEVEFVAPDEDIPTNLSFVDSYYGSKTPKAGQSKSSKSSTPRQTEALADSLLGEDLSQIASSSKKPWLESKIYMLDKNELEFIDPHFSPPKKKTKHSINQAALENAEYFPVRIRVRELCVIFNMHDGYDWSNTRDKISEMVYKKEAVAQARARHTHDDDDDDFPILEEPDHLFNSVWLDIPRNPGDLINAINTRAGMDDMSETSYATTTVESTVARSTRSRSSTFQGRDTRKTKLKLKRSRAQRVQIELKGVNAHFWLLPPDTDEVQLSLDVTVRDLEIFDNLDTSSWKKFVTYCREAGPRQMGSDMVRVEFMSVKPVASLSATELVLKANVLPLRLHVDQDCLEFLKAFFAFSDSDAPSAPKKPADEPFIQQCQILPIRIILDYKPKKLDYTGLRAGKTTELMNLVTLEGSDMTLRHVVVRGLAGAIGGVAPIKSFVGLGTSAKNLVSIPLSEYEKDGRLMRAIGKGMNGFAKNTAGELIRLGAKVAIGTQTLLQNTEEFLSGADPNAIVVVEGDEDDETGTGRVISLYADQPESIRTGLREAGKSLRSNFRDAQAALSTLPAEMAERGDAKGALMAFARIAPRAALRPAIGVTTAVAKTLQGVSNTMEPERKRLREDKYKRH